MELKSDVVFKPDVLHVRCVLQGDRGEQGHKGEKVWDNILFSEVSLVIEIKIIFEN